MNPYYWVGYHGSRLLAQLFFRFRILHRERMINSGPVILAMNHQALSRPAFGWKMRPTARFIGYLMRRTLLNVPVLGRILPKLNVIPVDQEGIDRSALKKLIQVVRDGNGALVFPEGSRTPDDLQVQPGQLGIGLVCSCHVRRAPRLCRMRIFGAHRRFAARWRPPSLCSHYGFVFVGHPDSLHRC